MISIKKVFLSVIFFCSISSAQNTVYLPFDNNGLNYLGDEIVVKGKDGIVRVSNISKPTLKVYRPNKKSLNSAVVIAPGGGMWINAMDHEGIKVADELNKNGISAFVLKYRLIPSIDKNSKNNNNTLQKKQLSYAYKDALNAIQYLRENSKKYGIDPDKIGLMGFSAGGAVTMEATYKSEAKNKPNFIAPIYPYMYRGDKQIPPKNGPPIFIVCANNDPLNIANKSVELYLDWINKDLSAEIHMFSEGGHGFGTIKNGYPIDSWLENMIQWIIFNIKN